MLTRFFEIVSSDNAVKLQFGVNPVRIFPYGTKMGLPVRKPYALYGTFNAVPYNYLDGRTDMDLSAVQVDIYAESESKAAQCFNAIREAIESEEDGYVTNYSTNALEVEDGLYRITMEIDFHDER